MVKILDAAADHIHKFPSFIYKYVWMQSFKLGKSCFCLIHLYVYISLMQSIHFWCLLCFCMECTESILTLYTFVCFFFRATYNVDPFYMFEYCNVTQCNVSGHHAWPWAYAREAVRYYFDLTTKPPVFSKHFKKPSINIVLIKHIKPFPIMT